MAKLLPHARVLLASLLFPHIFSSLSIVPFSAQLMNSGALTSLVNAIRLTLH